MQEGRREGSLGASPSAAGRDGPGVKIQVGLQVLFFAGGRWARTAIPKVRCPFGLRSPSPALGRRPAVLSRGALGVPAPTATWGPGAERRGRQSARLDFPGAPTARRARAPLGAGVLALSATSP